MAEQRFFWKNPWLWLGMGLLLTGIRGLWLDVMDVDASQYASISMEMSQNGSWLQVQHRHADYLDKPPLLFWSAAAAYRLLGWSNWAYKLPSFLGALLGVYATFRFARLFYPRPTARLAAFILAATTGMWLLCNDVRTDTLLMGMSAAAVWMLAEYQQGRRFAYVLGAGLCTGLAMLAKGPIGLILPVAAIGTHILLCRDWRSLFRWEWLPALGVTALVLLPMCVGLYQQFDLHPEKVVNGRTGVSGLYFYFWEQSFGRITGENVWKNNTSGFYFLHVYAWAFLPWTLFLIPAIWRRLRQIGQQGFKMATGEEAYSIGAFVLIFIALSQSKYKLPHYIFITLPWAAVLTAHWLSTASNARRWAYAQWVLALLLVLLLALIPGWMFRLEGIRMALWAPFGLLAAWILYALRPVFWGEERYWQGNVALGLLIGSVLNLHFYPHLLPYQSTSAAGRFFAEQGIPATQRGQMGYGGHALDFYANSIVPHFDTPDAALAQAQRAGGVYLYVREGGREQLDAAGIPYTVVAQFQHFQPALLKWAFLDPATREKTLIPAAIVHVAAPE